MTDENQNLTDEEILSNLGTDIDEDLPGDGDEGEVDDKEKKVRHAFAKKKRAAKQAIELAEKYRQDNERLRSDRENAASALPPADTSEGQATKVLMQLQNQAMSNLGLSEITQNNQEFVRMERDRLYNQKMGEVTQRQEVEQGADEAINSVLDNIGGLNEAGIVEVKKRLNGIDVLQRVKKVNIQNVVYQYLGEQVASGNLTASNGTEDDPSTSSRESTAATASAISAVKNGRSGVGVKPGRNTNTVEDKPATPEEQTQMLKMGVTDLRSFRKAKAQKHKYSGR